MSDFVWPPTPAVDDQVTGPYGEVYTWNGVSWTVTAGGSAGGGTSVSVGNTPPASPGAGNLWWDTVSVKLYMWNGLEWVIVANVPEGGGSSSGPLEGPIMGVTDGSNAAPGEVGEFLTTQVNTPYNSGAWTSINSLTLPPGDWDVSAQVSWSAPSPIYEVGACLSLSATAPSSIATLPIYRLAIQPQDGSVQLQFVNTTLSMMRSSSSTPVTVYLLSRVFTVAVSAALNSNAVIWARRVR